MKTLQTVFMISVTLVSLCTLWEKITRKHQGML